MTRFKCVAFELSSKKLLAFAELSFIDNRHDEMEFVPFGILGYVICICYGEKTLEHVTSIAAHLLHNTFEIQTRKMEKKQQSNPC